MSGIQAVTLATISGAFVWGLTLALWASLKQGLADKFPVQGRAATLATMLNVSLMLLTLLCGVLADRVGVRGVLISGSAALAAALLWLSTSPAWPYNLLALLLAALGAAAVSVSSVVLMPRAFFGPAEAMASVALGGVYVALGALVTSALRDVLLAALGTKRTLALLAFACLTPAFPAALASADALEGPGQHADVTVFLGHEEIWLGALVFLFYVPLEALVGLWTTSALAGATDEKGHGSLMTGFWIAFIGSRLAVAAIQHGGWLAPRWDNWLPVLPALLVAVVLGNLAGASARTRLRLGVWLLGAFLGPVFPALLGVLLRKYQEEAGTCYGLLFFVGSLGSLLLTPLLRPGATRPAAALRVPMFLALGLTAAALVFALSVS
jgi:hypothetical protein